MTGREDIFKKAMNLGHSAAWDQQWDKAVSAYRKALDEFPDDPKALSSLGLALFELQRFDEALQAYQKAVQASPNDPVPLEKAAQLFGRLGNIKEAIAAYLKSAELYIRGEESQKAVQCLVNIIQLDADHLPAHTYLAMMHERLGQKPQAINEYLAVASLFQRSGNADKAAEMVGRALRIDSSSAEARRAQNMLKSGQLLPKPMRPQGGTAPLTMALVRQLEAPKSQDSGLDPVAETQRKALTKLAEILFEISDENADTPAPRRPGMQAIMRGTGPLSIKQSDRSKIMLHISQAIDAQTRQDESQAVEELEKTIEAGIKNAAVYFNLGFLRAKTERYESGLRNLQMAVQHQGYALGARLLMGQVLRQMGRLKEAVVEYLEALKIADVEVVAPEHAAELSGLYEPIIESQKQLEDAAVQEKVCDNIHNLLMQPDWRARVTKAREQLPKVAPGTPPMPLAEMMAQAQSSQVIDTIGKVHALARAGFLRTAMDEAFEALKYAPTYLPLHSLIGDLLIQEGRTQDAITKYSVVAQAYRTRGEINSAVDLMRRILRLSPMDLNIRTALVELLSARGAVDEALGEYMDVADMHYRLAELDMARKTYAAGLRLAQQGESSRTWSIKILQRMADIDMQRLDWKQAMRVYEQIRTLEPNDIAVRKQLVNLNLRLGQVKQAGAELENFLSHLQSANQRAEAIPFLEELVAEQPQQPILRRALAEEYRQVNRIEEAVAQLDALGDFLLDAGDRSGAIQAIEAIVAMNPPNVADYIALLKKLEEGQPPA
jgi:tetratricopeptide (TPR) repeat protein